jgi:hypothetical protein
MQKEQNKYRLLVQAQNNLLKIRLYYGNFNYYFRLQISHLHSLVLIQRLKLLAGDNSNNVPEISMSRVNDKQFF